MIREKKTIREFKKRKQPSKSIQSNSIEGHGIMRSGFQILKKDVIDNLKNIEGD